MNSVQIIAEIGINHNASLKITLELIDAAQKAGADVVKFQKRVPEIAVPKDWWHVKRSTPWGVMDYIDYKKRMEFSKSDYDHINGYCENIDMPWTASAWDIPSVEFLEQYNIPFHKVPSACLTDDDLLIRMCKTGIPIYLSTGMSDQYQIVEAYDIILDAFHKGDFAKRKPVYDHITLMHCNSSYPCPVGDLNLRHIQTLAMEYPARVGYSGHETGIATTVAAVALGARVVERHITLDRGMWGTDQAASLTPEMFADMVSQIREVELALGDGVKIVTDLEKEVMKKLRVHK